MTEFDEEENEDEAIEENAANVVSLTEQALRAQSVTMSEQYASDGSVQIIEPPMPHSDKCGDEGSRRSKSEPTVSTTNQLTEPSSGNEVNNPIIIDDDAQIVPVKSVDEREREQTLGSNSSEKISKMRQNRRTLRLSAPPPPTTAITKATSELMIANELSVDPKDPKHQSSDVKISDNEHLLHKENPKVVVQSLDKGMKCDESKVESIEAQSNANINKVSEAQNDGNMKQLSPLRRSSRIKDKQQRELSDLQCIIPNQPKTKKAVNRKTTARSPPLSVTKTKKRRRLSNKKKTKQNKANSNDLDDDKENEKELENPRKRRKLNETVGAKKNVFVPDECEEEKDKISENGKEDVAEMRFPFRRIVEEDEDDSDVAISDKLVTPPKKIELRRSTRKASLRATKNLMKEKPKRNSHQKKKKVALSQKVVSNNKRNKKPRRKRRNSTNTKRA